MAAIDALLDRLSPDPAVLVTLMIATLLGIVALVLIGALQDRAEVRRRATEGFERRRGGERTPASEANRSLERLMRFIETTFANYDKREMAVLRLQLVQGGFYHQRAPAIFFAARFGCGILACVGAIPLLPLVLAEGSNVWMYAAGMGALGYFAPTFLLRRRIARRVDQHRTGFPDFMDLMVVCAEAGLSMEASIDRVARELVPSYPSLGENLYMVSLEMRAGKPFGEALMRLGQRLGISEATSLASLLQQSSELGTSLASSLRIYSDEMRHKRMSRAEEKAHSLPAKLVVPLMLFVFPVLLATLAIPIVIRVGSAF